MTNTQTRMPSVSRPLVQALVRRGEEEAANWKKRLAESEDAARKGNDEAAALRRQYAELQVGCTYTLTRPLPSPHLVPI